MNLGDTLQPTTWVKLNCFCFVFCQCRGVGEVGTDVIRKTRSAADKEITFSSHTNIAASIRGATPILNLRRFAQPPETTV